MGYNREEYLRNKLIGERLAALRHYNNLTPGEFAKRICVSPNIVEPVELNTADMYSDSVLKLISLEFNVSLSWLLSGKAEPTDPKEIDNFNIRQDTDKFTYSEIQVEEILTTLDATENRNTLSEQTLKLENELKESLGIQDDYEMDIFDYSMSCYWDGFLSGYRHATQIIKGMLSITNIPDEPPLK